MAKFNMISYCGLGAWGVWRLKYIATHGVFKLKEEGELEMVFSDSFEKRCTGEIKIRIT